jgi:hypothetical protein
MKLKELQDKMGHWVNISLWLATGLWFSPSTLISCTNKTDRHDIIEILFKVALSTINQTKPKITPVKNYLDFGRYIFISEMSRMVDDGRRSFYNGRHVLWLYQLLSNHRFYITYAYYLARTAINCVFSVNVSILLAKISTWESHKVFILFITHYLICPSLDEMIMV